MARLEVAAPVEPGPGVREFARLFGVSTATVYRGVSRGQIAHVRVSSAIQIRVKPP